MESLNINTLHVTKSLAQGLTIEYCVYTKSIDIFGLNSNSCSLNNLGHKTTFEVSFAMINETKCAKIAPWVALFCSNITHENVVHPPSQHSLIELVLANSLTELDYRFSTRNNSH